MKEVLKIQNLKKYYGSNLNITKAINGISFNVLRGEFVAIMGASGSGNTEKDYFVKKLELSEIIHSIILKI